MLPHLYFSCTLVVNGMKQIIIRFLFSSRKLNVLSLMMSSDGPTQRRVKALFNYKGKYNDEVSGIFNL